MKIKSDEERLAYHEAGHAVACIELGLRFKSVSIIKNNKSLGRVLFKNLNLGSDTDFNDRIKNKCVKYIISALAGPASEMKFMKKVQSELSKQDFENATIVAQSINDSLIAANAHIKYLNLKAKSLFTDLDSKTNKPAWKKVQFIAHLLIKDGYLDYNEVKKAIEFIENFPHNRKSPK